MAKKPPRYPRKLRQTLEKVAEKRDERTKVAELQEKYGSPFDTLWRDFMLRGSAHAVHVDFEKMLRNERLDMDYVINPPFHKLADHIYPRPPWLRDLPPVDE